MAESRSLVMLAVSLPLLVFLFGTASSEYRSRTSEDWEFVARGYDPRDLLRGHYIRYRVELGETAGSGCANDDPDCCLCLMRDPGARESLAPASVRRMSCSAAKTSCDGRLRASRLSSLRRFYVPESRARDIERQLLEAAQNGDARVVVAVDRMGRPQVRELRVAGRRLE